MKQAISELAASKIKLTSFSVLLLVLPSFKKEVEFRHDKQYVAEEVVPTVDHL